MTDHLPIVRRSISIRGRDWLIDAVEDQDALLMAAETSAQFPFGLMLWESATALAEALCDRAGDLAGTQVLELGAGLGLAGVVAATLGAQVVQTDHDAMALAACRQTAHLNGVRDVRAAIGDWHDWRMTEVVDLIIGADVIYDAADHAVVLTILSRTLAPSGAALFTDPMRENQHAFIVAATAAGWTVVRSIVHVADLKSTSGAVLPIALLELRCSPVFDIPECL